MKYQVGNLILIKNIDFHPCLHLRYRPRLRPHRQLRLHYHLQNTFGIITEVEKHTDIFKKGSTENDNGYIWYSQVDGKEYHFYEDEVEGEVVK